jgi:hypothetical protein
MNKKRTTASAAGGGGSGGVGSGGGAGGAGPYNQSKHDELIPHMCTSNQQHNFRVVIDKSDHFLDTPRSDRTFDKSQKTLNL